MLLRLCIAHLAQEIGLERGGIVVEILVFQAQKPSDGFRIVIQFLTAVRRCEIDDPAGNIVWIICETLVFYVVSEKR